MRIAPPLALTLTLSLLAAACGREGGDAAAAGAPPGLPVTSDSAAPAAAPVLVDPEIPGAVAGEGGWEYVRSSSADLDGDGVEERVVLTARAALVRGRPAWDDGQPWQVYVEAADGTRTYVYSRRLQIGTLTARVGHAGAGDPAPLYLLEHLPDSLSLYEVVYQGPGRVEVRERFRDALDPVGDLASPVLP